jgi:hypothetical protein
MGRIGTVWVNENYVAGHNLGAKESTTDKHTKTGNFPVQNCTEKLPQKSGNIFESLLPSYRITSQNYLTAR